MQPVPRVSKAWRPCWRTLTKVRQHGGDAYSVCIISTRMFNILRKSQFSITIMLTACSKSSIKSEHLDFDSTFQNIIQNRSEFFFVLAKYRKKLLNRSNFNFISLCHN